MRNESIRTNNMAPFYGGSGAENRTDGDDEYVVAPGVLSQSDVYAYPRANRPGATHEYLSDDAIEDSVDEWDGVPLLLDHPHDDNGMATTIPQSSDDPAVIGEIRSPEATSDGEMTKLQGEAWVDRSNVGEYDGDVEAVVDAIESGGIVETSAAYQAGRELSPGVANGSRYDAVQSSIEPDHVAVFSPEDGAEGNCSVAAGCGIGRANAPYGAHDSNIASGASHTLGGRVLSALGLGDLSGPRANSATNDEQNGDESAESDADQDSTGMKDSEKIDYLVEEHGLDRANMAPLEGTDCLGDIYDRYSATANENENDDGGSDPEPSDDGDGIDKVLNRIEELEERIDAPKREKKDAAASHLADEMGIDADDVSVDADAADEILERANEQRQTPRYGDGYGDGGRANMAARPGPVDNDESDGYVASRDDGSRFDD